MPAPIELTLPAGPPGTPGNTILATVGAPANSTGVIGDWAIDSAAGILYGPKDSSGTPWAAQRSLVGPPVASVPYVTFIDSTPTAEQEIYYEADPAKGSAWHLKWIAALSKWVFLGGSALSAEVVAGETTSSTTYADLATVGPQVVIPQAGIYEILIGAATSNSAANGQNHMSLAFGATGAVDNEIAHAQSATANAVVPVVRTMPRTITGTFPMTLTAKYKVTTGVGSFSRRYMVVRPVSLQ